MEAGVLGGGGINIVNERRWDWERSLIMCLSW